MSEPVSRRALWFQKLADEVARSIKARIEEGELEPGDRVGTRDELAAHYVTAHGVVSRAVDRLVEEGVLTDHGTDGLLVAERTEPEAPFTLPETLGDRLEDVFHVLELRIGVEAQAAALAARLRGGAALDNIRQAARAFEAEAGRQGDVAQADYAFHHAIAEASGNPYILDLLEHLGPLLIPRMRVPLPSPDGPEQNLRNSVREHAAIVDALEQGDADQARAAMRQHLTRTMTLMRGLDTSAG